MEKSALTAKHREKLAEYYLQDVPAANCFVARYSAGEPVFRENERINHLSLVVSGMAKVFISSTGGKNLILCYYQSDGLIGEVELLSQHKTADSTVMAVSDFVCVNVDFSACAAQLQTNILFLRRIAEALAEKLYFNADNFALTALYTAEQRVCTYILHHSPNDNFADVLTDVACSLGTSYRHLLRILSQLCSEGILLKVRRSYTVLDRERLTARSQQSEH